MQFETIEDYFNCQPWKVKNSHIELLECILKLLLHAQELLINLKLLNNDKSNLSMLVV